MTLGLDNVSFVFLFFLIYSRVKTELIDIIIIRKKSSIRNYKSSGIEQCIRVFLFYPRSHSLAFAFITLYRTCACVCIFSSSPRCKCHTPAVLYRSLSLFKTSRVLNFSRSGKSVSLGKFRASSGKN